MCLIKVEAICLEMLGVLGRGGGGVGGVWEGKKVSYAELGAMHSNGNPNQQ